MSDFPFLLFCGRKFRRSLAKLVHLALVSAGLGLASVDSTNCRSKVVGEKIASVLNMYRLAFLVITP